MKKALVIVACVALVGVFSSCEKKCTCTTYPDETKTEFNLDKLNETYHVNIEKCSDFNIGNKENGLICK